MLRHVEKELEWQTITSILGQPCEVRFRQMFSVKWMLTRHTTFGVKHLHVELPDRILLWKSKRKKYGNHVNLTILIYSSHRPAVTATTSCSGTVVNLSCKPDRYHKSYTNGLSALYISAGTDYFLPDDSCSVDDNVLFSWKTFIGLSLQTDSFSTRSDHLRTSLGIRFLRRVCVSVQ